MTHVAKLGVQHVRNHSSKSITLSPDTTVITGKNGAGKTSLIEAVYIALQGTSFRGGDSEVLQKNQPWYRIDVELSDGTTRTVKFDSTRQTGRKQFIVNEKTSYRLSAKDKFPLVLFEPDDLRLISGSPVRRRHFIDHFISQIDAEYHHALRRYERALRQRNNLLKQDSIKPDELFVWNVALSEYGAYIITERVAFIEKINQRLTDIYQSISGTNDTVSVHYSHTLVDTIQQKLLSELSKNIQKDKLLGFTTIGPHRDDVLFQFNTSPAATTTSRGENRTIVLALKFIEVEIIKDLTDINPIVLFDDVFSELDEARQKALSHTSSQLIITGVVENTHKNIIRI